MNFVLQGRLFWVEHIDSVTQTNTMQNKIKVFHSQFNRDATGVMWANFPDLVNTQVNTGFQTIWRLGPRHQSITVEKSIIHLQESVFTYPPLDRKDPSWCSLSQSKERQESKILNPHVEQAWTKNCPLFQTCLASDAGHVLSTFMYASEGMEFGSHPLLDRVEQLHTANAL